MLLNVFVRHVDDQHRLPTTTHTLLAPETASQRTFAAPPSRMCACHPRGSQRPYGARQSGCCCAYRSVSLPRTTAAPMTVLSSSNTPHSRSKRPLWRSIDQICACLSSELCLNRIQKIPYLRLYPQNRTVGVSTVPDGPHTPRIPGIKQ